MTGPSRKIIKTRMFIDFVAAHILFGLVIYFQKWW
jgi:hypothetical protein